MLRQVVHGRSGLVSARTVQSHSIELSTWNDVCACLISLNYAMDLMCWNDKIYSYILITTFLVILMGNHFIFGLTETHSETPSIFPICCILRRVYAWELHRPCFPRVNRHDTNWLQRCWSHWWKRSDNIFILHLFVRCTYCNSSITPCFHNIRVPWSYHDN